MIDPTDDELASMSIGGEKGGEYLDSINKSDLASLSLDEWETFIRCVVTGYIEEMQKRAKPR